MGKYKLTFRDYWYAHVTWNFRRVKEWIERWIYAQHNARVIMDFEDRMMAVIHEATGYMMSKPYYTKEAMLAEISSYHERLYDMAYQEGRKDLADEHDIELDEGTDNG